MDFTRGLTPSIPKLLSDLFPFHFVGRGPCQEYCSKVGFKLICQNISLFFQLLKLHHLSWLHETASEVMQLFTAACTAVASLFGQPIFVHFKFVFVYTARIVCFLSCIFNIGRCSWLNQQGIIYRP